MKTLTLIRHAKSSWDDPQLADVDRPLNSRGQRDAPVMGDRVARRRLAPDLLLSSPARRALTTARVFAQALDYPAEAIRTNDDIYAAPGGVLLNILRSLDGSAHRVFLFGHNPGFTELANLLARETAIDNVPTCGVVHLTLNIPDWAAIAPGCGRVVFFDYPKKRDPA